MFVLVRHGYAGDKKAWKQADMKRPLTLGGREEAVGLAQTLGGLGVTELMSSPYLRCRQTLSPLAAATGLKVHTSDLLVPEPNVAALDKWVNSSKAEGWVFCTHGETLNALIERWDRRGRLAGSDKPPSTLPKGSALVVRAAKKGLKLYYLQPVRVVDAQQLRRVAAG